MKKDRVAGPSGQRERRDADFGRNDEEKRTLLIETHRNLIALGARVSENDLAQVYKGPYGETINFFVNHVVGRRNVTNARAQIQMYLEVSSYLNSSFLYYNMSRCIRSEERHICSRRRIPN